LERSFHDGLFPALQYRGEAQEEEWEANTGTEIFMSRPGLLAPITRPIAPGVDPQPQTVSYEQWAAKLARYAGTIDTHVPTSVVSNADLFLRNIHQLGLQAGQSLNRIPRNEMFKAYLSGQTNLTAATAAVDTTINVASLNGFTDVILQALQGVRPQPVSSATPLSITLDPGGANIVRNVIAAIPDNPDDPFGPGQLQLSAAVGAIVAIRGAVWSSARPDIIRAGGGTSVDAIAANDTFKLQDAINATNRLRKNSVPPHEDGYYHAHISTDGNTQIFEDDAFQRLNTSLPDHVYYQEAFIGTIAGIAFFLNTESPDSSNSGDMVATGSLSRYSRDIGAETVNATGVGIGRIIVTGRGVIYEKYLDEGKYVTEAGLTGKQGEFQIVNAGIEVQTQRIRLILRSPVNRLQDIVSASWSITTSFPIPSDVTSGGPQRYKRAIVIEHAIAA
jgi:hypothetical protein